MSIEEEVAVMQAFAEGKEIEIRTKDPFGTSEWTLCEAPNWNWGMCDYRIKGVCNYVPFETVDEAFAAIELHGNWTRLIGDKVTSKTFPTDCNYILITGIYSHEGKVYANGISAEELLKHWQFADGTPCGKEVTE